MNSNVEDLEIIRTEIEPKLDEILKRLELTTEKKEEIMRISKNLTSRSIDDFVKRY